MAVLYFSLRNMCSINQINPCFHLQYIPLILFPECLLVTKFAVYKQLSMISYYLIKYVLSYGYFN